MTVENRTENCLRSSQRHPYRHSSGSRRSRRVNEHLPDRTPRPADENVADTNITPVVSTSMMPPSKRIRRAGGPSAESGTRQMHETTRAGRRHESAEYHRSTASASSSSGSQRRQPWGVSNSSTLNMMATSRDSAIRTSTLPTCERLSSDHSTASRRASRWHRYEQQHQHATHQSREAPERRAETRRFRHHADASFSRRRHGCHSCDDWPHRHGSETGAQPSGPPVALVGGESAASERRQSSSSEHALTNRHRENLSRATLDEQTTPDVKETMVVSSETAAARRKRPHASVLDVALTVCSICLVEDPETLGRLPRCLHMFCLECILKWANVTNCCPLCKERFVEVHRLLVKPGIGYVQDGDPIAVETKDMRVAEERYFCSLCRSTDGQESFLVCDGCTGAYHTYCLGLDSPPQGFWYCEQCRELGLGSAQQILQHVMDYWAIAVLLPTSTARPSRRTLSHSRDRIAGIQVDVVCLSSEDNSSNEDVEIESDTLWSSTTRFSRTLMSTVLRDLRGLVQRDQRQSHPWPFLGSDLGSGRRHRHRS